MPVVSELILLRHGQSAANVAFPAADAQGLVDSGLTGRDRDVELTELGVTQARAVGAWLAGLPADRVPEIPITSPYLRARETWRIAAETSGLSFPPATTDERLVDRLLGDLEMMTRAAVKRDFPDDARFHGTTDYQWRPRNGESFGDIRVRLKSFLDDVNERHAGRRVVVTAHDSVVLMMRAVIEDLDWDGVDRVAAGNTVRNASISVFDGRGGSLVLDRYNTVDHLDDTPPLTLPPPVRAVFDATNAADSDAFVAAFAPDGVIDDWGTTYQGHDGIRGWNNTDNIGVQARLDPSGAAWDHDEYVVTATVSGNGFNGESHFRFQVADNLVTRMTIRA